MIISFQDIFWVHSVQFGVEVGIPIMTFKVRGGTREPTEGVTLTRLSRPISWGRRICTKICGRASRALDDLQYHILPKHCIGSIYKHITQCVKVAFGL